MFFQCSGVAPTEVELQKAKKVLAKLTPSQVKSKYQSMQHHLKLNPDAEAEGAKGEKRKEFLHTFLAMQLRVKAGESFVKNSHSVAEINEKKTDTYEWSAEQMDTNLGAVFVLHICCNKYGKASDLPSFPRRPLIARSITTRPSLARISLVARQTDR